MQVITKTNEFCRDWSLNHAEPYRRGLKLISDVGQLGVPIYAGLFLLATEDIEGLKGYFLALIINQIMVEILKRATNEMRPSGHTRNSFPSGHTAVVFCGAVALAQRIGIRNAPYSVVISAICATVVGATRVLLRAHWLHDVVAAALLAATITVWTTRSTNS